MTELQPWEPTDGEIEDVLQEAVVDEDAMTDLRKVGIAFVKKYRDHLIAQVGPEPCKGCRGLVTCRKNGYIAGQNEDKCPQWGHYQGQLAQRAKDEAEIAKAREEMGKEIVEWLRHMPVHSYFNGQPWFPLSTIVAWLEG